MCYGMLISSHRALLFHPAAMIAGLKKKKRNEGAHAHEFLMFFPPIFHCPSFVVVLIRSHHGHGGFTSSHD